MVVDRRRLRRLREAATKQGAIVVETRDGRTEVYSEWAALGLFSLGMDEALGVSSAEPTEDPRYGEALRLREALANAIPASKAAYEEQNFEFLHTIKVIERSRKEMVS